MSSSTDSRKSPAKVTFSHLTQNNIGVVRKLNSVLFPVKYAEKYYKDILALEVEEFCQLVYYNDIPVGNFTCRLESESKGRTSLYLMTMGILAPYRSRGVGSQVMKKLLDSVTQSQSPKIDRIYLHVQISNTAGRAFYERHGFREAGLHKDYYKKIQPRDAWILEKVFADSSTS
ncbi:N-acetyltransferase NAT13 [Thelephora terrestris]|uniref:N-acetyltransferase NAT13 n=1 Tax=Thelephora terrestris TaxID=56493 RepID=A0A9P6HQ64_9AGAM|nr:N-acetyltransferase NAT13 [Thelephora terrestris]